jgi:hypothetical protein
LAYPQLFVTLGGREAIAIFEEKVFAIAFVLCRDIILRDFLGGQDEIVAWMPVHLSLNFLLD